MKNLCYPKIKTSESCRFCPHNAVDHLFINTLAKESMIVYWVQCGKSKYSKGCLCPGFAPLDNLLYLEMKSDSHDA